VWVRRWFFAFKHDKILILERASKKAPESREPEIREAGI
jgi:hypothetical protein